MADFQITQVGATLQNILDNFNYPTNGHIGIPYVDPQSRGANPAAVLFPDGSVVGGTANGRYIKEANGTVRAFGTKDIIGSHFTVVDFPLQFLQQQYNHADNRTGGQTSTTLSTDAGSVTQMTVYASVTTTTTAAWYAEGVWK